MNVKYEVENVTAILESQGNVCLSVTGMNGIFGWRVFEISTKRVYAGRDGYKTKGRCLKAARIALERIAAALE